MAVRVNSQDETLGRRRAQRFTVDWEIVVRGKDELGSSFDEAGNLRDLSPRGAFLSISRELRVGAKLDVWIRMPSEPERWMVYTGEVVRVEEDHTGFGAATKFLTPRPKLHLTPPQGLSE